MVAVKALKADCGSQLRTGWRREIDILRTLYHEHIVQYKGCCEDQGGRNRTGRSRWGGAIRTCGQLEPLSSRLKEAGCEAPKWAWLDCLFSIWGMLS